MTITEANAVNQIWQRATWGGAERAWGCDEWIAFRTLAKSANKALMAGVTVADVERAALKNGADIRPEKRGSHA